MVDIVLFVLLAAAAGGFAGWGGRRLLGTLRRGVRPTAGWCECAVAGLWAVTAGVAVVRQLPPWWAALPLVLGWFAVLLCACDVLAARLPDALTLPAYPVVAVALCLSAHLSGVPPPLGGALAGAAIYGGCYAATRWVRPRSMGAGDVKLAGSLGAVTGSASLSGVFLCMLASALLTLPWAWFRRAGVPHGPAMLAPVWVLTVCTGPFG